VRTARTPIYRQRIIDAAAAAEPTLALGAVTAAVDAVLTHPAVARDLAAALADDPNAFMIGAPPAMGRLIEALRERGSRLTAPACVLCAVTGKALTRSPAGGVCERCRRRQLAQACARCGVTKPVAGRDAQHRPVCARCSDRPKRTCGRCGQTRRIARRARDGQPDICDSCFRMPDARSSTASTANAESDPRPPPTGCSRACNPAARSPPPVSGNAYAPSASGHNPDDARR